MIAAAPVPTLPRSLSTRDMWTMQPVTYNGSVRGINKVHTIILQWADPFLKRFYGWTIPLNFVPYLQHAH